MTMTYRLLACIASLVGSGLAAASRAAAASFTLLFAMLAWPSIQTFRGDPTPRSIFETRRAGLA